MLFLSDYLNQFVFTILVLTSLLSIYLMFSYKKMKKIEKKKLSLIYKEIKKEKNNTEQLKTNNQKIKYIENETQQKIQVIKVGLLNINFSFGDFFY